MATMADIAYTVGVNSGTIVIPCDGTCEMQQLEHRFMFYTPEEALDLYNRVHGVRDD